MGGILQADAYAGFNGLYQNGRAPKRGGERAAIMYTLIQTAKLNNIDPQAWLADAGEGLPLGSAMGLGAGVTHE